MRHLPFLPALALAALPAQIPRPEHPQPQFQRQPGRISTDPGNSSSTMPTPGWMGLGRPARASSAAPSPCRSASRAKRAASATPSFHPWIWYRTRRRRSAGWKGKRMLLHFGAVDYQAMVWVNGQSAGWHEGGNVPFAFDVTPLLKRRLERDHRAGGGSADRPLHPARQAVLGAEVASIFYTRTSGIWQTVWLEAAGRSYFERCASPRRTTAPSGSTAPSRTPRRTWSSSRVARWKDAGGQPRPAVAGTNMRRRRVRRQRTAAVVAGQRRACTT